MRNAREMFIKISLGYVIIVVIIINGNGHVALDMTAVSMWKF